MKKCLLSFFFFLTVLSAFPQAVTQQVYGTVKNSETLAPVPEALLLLLRGESSYRAISDSAGHYRFPAVPPGRYQLQVSHVAYQREFIPEVYVKASRPEIVPVHLQPRELLLQEAEITPATLPANINQNLFTIEETQRFPATFYDPARLVRSQPGVTAANDQANLISVHGQSPNHVGWQIEGVEVLNPNHLPNAGRPSDRSTSSGGGVNILSGQLMDNSSFYTGSLPASMGNSLGGLFDIKLRPGSTTQQSHTLQASLLGIDLATEGPLSKNRNSSYLLNYRYSTVGLLSKFGVNFGNEEIQFQDLAFHLNWRGTAVGNISFFGFGGLSRNYLSLQEDPASWKRDKDGQQVSFKAGMGALGVRHSIPLGRNASLQNGFIYSGRYSRRTARAFMPDLTLYEATSEDIRQELFALKSSLSLQHTAEFNTTLGLAANFYRTGLEATPGNLAPFSHFDLSLSYTSLQPFADLRYRWSPDWLLQAGLRLLIDSQNEILYPEPRLQLIRKVSPGSSLQLGYSLLSQPMLNQPNLLPALFIGEERDKSLEPTRSHYTSLGYEQKWKEKTVLKTKVYYQHFYLAPVTALPHFLATPFVNSSFSALHVVEEYALWPLENTGSGRTYGLDASLQRYFIADFYYLFGFSLFDASYEDAEGIRRNMRFNSQYNLNLTAGREWSRQKEGELRSWGIHLRSLYHGGFWYTPIDVEASRGAATTILDYSQAFTERLSPYFTLDIRLSHTKEKSKYQRIWSIDIQNVLNRRNVGWYYYDQLQQEVLPVYQLGIIPVLAYRIEF